MNNEEKPLSGENAEVQESGTSETQTAEQSLREELTKKTQEYNELQEKYLRLAAEFENYKRRIQREQVEQIKFANEKILKELLTTVDNLERAIQCGRDQQTVGALLEGVELTYKHLVDTLTKFGVKQIESAGQPFDPSKHQAVAQVEAPSTPPNMVVEEYQKGYLLNERILRPAMVTVSKEPSDKNQPSTGDQHQGEEGADQ
ncbi:MAG: nucleotide exchange factor GrpE [Nitrospirae bacterium]|nr:MAG: nucleotide exchange factor GrpE [Nitrospirota bacterium]